MKAHITGTDASPSAQKAAGNKDAATRAVDRLIEQKLLDPEQRYNIGQIIRVEYEKDITEAVDAAVAQERERYVHTAQKWRECSTQERHLGIGYCLAKADIYSSCASELETLMGDK